MPKDTFPAAGSGLPEEQSLASNLRSACKAPRADAIVQTTFTMEG
jgi:hypothetical protein